MPKLQKTTALVIETSISSGLSTYHAQSSGYNQKISYRPSIQYQYMVDGQQYTNDTYAQRPFLLNNQGIIKRILDNYPEGSTVDIYYNPDNPQESFLQKGYGGAVNLILLSVLLLFVIVVGIALFFVMSSGI